MDTSNTEQGGGMLGIDELGTILSIWAHPDDETYLAGGVMAAAVDNGQRVVCVTATAGELGTSDPDAWPPEQLGELRRKESAAAMSVLGVSEHRVLGLPDGALCEHDPAGTEWVRELLDEIRPHTVLTFGADGMTFHPDHIAVHRWVGEVCNELDRPVRLLHSTWTADHLARYGPLQEELGIFMTDERPAGAQHDELRVHLRLDGRELDRKLAALQAMPSQTTPLLDAVGPDVYITQIVEESFVEAS